IHLAVLEAESKGEAPGMKTLQRSGRGQDYLKNFLRRLGRDLLDIHATFGGGDAGGAAAAPIDEHSQINLAGDFRALLDIDALYILALRPGLMGHQFHAEHGIGFGHHVLDRAADLDAARLAAPAGMDLRLYYPDGAVEFLGDGFGLLGRMGDVASRDRHAIAAQQLLCLIFVDIHEPTPGVYSDKSKLRKE